MGALTHFRGFRVCLGLFWKCICMFGSLLRVYLLRPQYLDLALARKLRTSEQDQDGSLFRVYPQYILRRDPQILRHSRTSEALGYVWVSFESESANESYISAKEPHISGKKSDILFDFPRLRECRGLFWECVGPWYLQQIQNICNKVLNICNKVLCIDRRARLIRKTALHIHKTALKIRKKTPWTSAKEPEILTRFPNFFFTFYTLCTHSLTSLFWGCFQSVYTLANHPLLRVFPGVSWKCIEFIECI